MSIDEFQPYYTDNEEDEMYLYYNMIEQDNQGLLFADQYPKNISDCPKSQIENSHINALPTNKTIQSPKSLPNLKPEKHPIQKQREKIDTERFIQQSAPSINLSEQTRKPYSQDDRKSKRINKKRKNRKIQIVLDYEERLQQSRQIKIERYRSKKSKRNWQRGILYEERKKLACRRQRVQGRFQGKQEMIQKMDEQKSNEDKIQQ